MKLNAKGIIMRKNTPVGDFFPVTIYSENMDPDDGYMEFSFVRQDNQKVLLRDAKYFAPGVIVDERLFFEWFQHLISTMGGQYTLTPRKAMRHGVVKITNQKYIAHAVIRLHGAEEDMLILLDEEKTLNRHTASVPVTILDPGTNHICHARASVRRDRSRVVVSIRDEHNNTTRTHAFCELKFPKPLSDEEIFEVGNATWKRDYSAETSEIVALPGDSKISLEEIAGFYYYQDSISGAKVAIMPPDTAYKGISWSLHQLIPHMTHEESILFSDIHFSSDADRAKKAFALLQSINDRVNIRVK